MTKYDIIKIEGRVILQNFIIKTKHCEVKTMQEPRNKIPQRLRQLRQSRKWTKTYVAEKLGKKLSTYSNWEYGAREPDADMLIKIAELYNVSVGYIIGTTDIPKEKTKEEIEDEEFFKKIEDLKLKEFLANLKLASIDDLNTLYTLWQVINKNKNVS